MKDIILEQLKEIEKDHNVRILLAVESGSRAWGFASTDSDYDVRFIYVRPKEEYLRLDEVRDVIELPINNDLDINGWDLQKTLRLLYQSNPTLFEWFSSPIIYMETPFADAFREMMLEYFSRKKGMFHYISMAEHNNREFLKGDMVKVKKYFYVLRPILACHWIMDKMTPPPMLFKDLMEAELPEHLKNEVDNLLELKMNSPEIKMIPKVEVLNAYIDEEIDVIKTAASETEQNKNTEWDRLNQFFLSVLADEK